MKQKLRKAFVEAYERWRKQEEKRPDETEEFYFSVEKLGRKFIIHSNHTAENHIHYIEKPNELHVAEGLTKS